MNRLAGSFALLTLAAAAATAVFGAEVPRPTPEFTLNLQNGKQELLSKYRGKVMLVEFLFTTCPHCQHTAQMVSKLQTDLGPQGFQAVGIAFNEMASMLVPDFVKNYGANFPVAWANRDAVLGYLSISQMERFVVPQIVIIDRKGVIRAQSSPLGDPNLQDEAYLRKMLDGLLKEPVKGGAPTSSVQKKPAATAASAAQPAAAAAAAAQAKKK